MAKCRQGYDVLVALRGLNSVSKAATNITEAELKEAWKSSSVVSGFKSATSHLLGPELSQGIKEAAGRSLAVAQGAREFSIIAASQLIHSNFGILDGFSSKKGSTDPILTQEFDSFDESNFSDFKNDAGDNTSEIHSSFKSTSHQMPSPLGHSSILKREFHTSSIFWSQGIKSSPSPANTAPIVKKKRSKLGRSSKEIEVPSSRISRLVSYGGLAAGLGVGALAEITRRALGMSGGKIGNEEKMAILDGNPFLTEANAERIVNTLCKVRGAALKLGQMLSIQDNSLINPQLLRIFERVRESADFMPVHQMRSVLVQEFGPEWRSKLQDFQEQPFAAASVGQVHIGTLHDGREIAMKIQYPGVAEGIDSDINNLVAIMKVWNILPPALYLDEFIKVAKRELGWEVDYIREAENTKRFKKLLENMPDYKVPSVVDELCSKQIFTTEFVEGISMEQVMELDQETRNHVAKKILFLCLSELFEFRFMQTDPNWANFMYDPSTRQVVLLDFGASREYSKNFVDKYIKVIEGAAENDREKVLDYSRELGFLAGYETKVMEDAHVDAVMILGEAFRSDGPFDFGKQDTTRRIQKLIPVMLAQRICPPPEESYSLHRKMSGAFLLCAKLGAKIECRPYFDDVVLRYYNQA